MIQGLPYPGAGSSAPTTRPGGGEPDQMSEHAVEAAFRRDGMLRGQTSAANDVDQLSRLASLREDGVIDEFEFLRMKARVIA